MVTTIIVAFAIVGVVAFILGLIADQGGEPAGLLLVGSLIIMAVPILILAFIGGTHLWGGPSP